MNKFVLLTIPRTGSTLLVKTLDTHPEIFCAGEIFLLSGKMYHNEKSFRFWKLPFLNNKLHYLLNYPNVLLNLKSFLNDFYKEGKNNIKAKGFKLMHYQTLYTPGLLNYLKKNNVKVILLVRQNVLKNALSDLRARSTGIYHNTNDNDAGQLPKLNVNIEALKNKMQQITATQHQLDTVTSDMNRLKIYYEDFKNWHESVANILNFLQVSPIPLSESVQKLNPDKLEDMIENYTEFQGWIKQNNYEHFL
jgi:LPS sulfotransferase NodH